jgi:hypothetical protein
VSNSVRATGELNGDPLAAGFLALPAAQVERLVAESLELDVPAGAIVYREGDPPRCFDRFVGDIPAMAA